VAWLSSCYRVVLIAMIYFFFDPFSARFTDVAALFDAVVGAPWPLFLFFVTFYCLAMPFCMCPAKHFSMNFSAFCCILNSICDSVCKCEKCSERRKHCALAVVRWSQKFLPRRRPLPGVQNGQNLISWRWSLVWWRSMHAVSSYHGNRPTNTNKQTHRQDQLPYTALLSLPCSVNSWYNTSTCNVLVLAMSVEDWKVFRTRKHYFSERVAVNLWRCIQPNRFGHVQTLFGWMQPNRIWTCLNLPLPLLNLLIILGFIAVSWYAITVRNLDCTDDICLW